MTADLDALEALAKAATPGPWVLDNSGWSRPYSVPDRIAGGISENDWTNVIMPQDEQGGGSWSRDEDAEYIAAADPSTILALIAELRRERERADRAEWAAGIVGDVARESSGGWQDASAELHAVEAALSRAVQGEPADAECVEIANRAQAVTGRSIWPSTVREVLRAAAAVREEGQGR